MSKKIIAVDIDDVLAHSAQAIIDYGNERYGHSNTIEEFTEQTSVMWQVTKEESSRRWIEFIESGVFNTFKVIPEAKAVLEHLHKNYSIYAVSSRRDIAFDTTTQWLETNYPGLVDKLVLCGIFGKMNPDDYKQTKADKLKEIGADYLIDDQPKHCIGASEAGIPSVLYGDYPWQRDAKVPKDVISCKTWQDVERYFDGQKRV